MKSLSQHHSRELEMTFEISSFEITLLEVSLGLLQLGWLLVYIFIEFKESHMRLVMKESCMNSEQAAETLVAKQLGRSCDFDENKAPR